MRAVIAVVDDHPFGVTVLGARPCGQLRLGRVGVLRERRLGVIVVDAPRGALIRNDMHFIHGFLPANGPVAAPLDRCGYLVNAHNGRRPWARCVVCVGQPAGTRPGPDTPERTARTVARFGAPPRASGRVRPERSGAAGTRRCDRRADVARAPPGLDIGSAISSLWWSEGGERAGTVVSRRGPRRPHGNALQAACCYRSRSPP